MRLQLAYSFLLLALLSSLQTQAELSLVVGPDSGLINPFGMAFNEKEEMYIAEYEGDRLWKFTESKGLERLGEDVAFNGMHNLCRTRDGRIYISDTRANLIRMLDEKTGEITIFGGTGKEGYNGEGVKAEDALLADPISISLSPDDTRLYIADIRNRRVRYIDLNTNRIYTLAGIGLTGVPEDGARADRSPLLDPRGVAEDSKGNVYILSRRGHALRVVKPDGKIYTLAGTGTAHKTDGPALMAGLNGPKHICIDLDDSVIIADAENHLIKRYDPDRKTIETLFDRGPSNSPLRRPHGVWVRQDGALYVCDSYNDRILKLER